MKRRLSPYLVALVLVWGVPLAATGVLSAVLPHQNPDGRCEGIGFGCTPAPADQLLLLAVLAVPFLGVVSVVVVVAISLRRAATRRRSDRAGGGVRS